MVTTMTQHQKIFLTIIALTLFICGRLESRRSEFANYDDFKFPRKDVRLELELGNIWAEGHRMDQRVQEWVSGYTAGSGQVLKVGGGDFNFSGRCVCKV